MAEEDVDCIYSELIADLSKACEYAKTNCADDFEVFNFLKYQYCSLPQSSAGVILFWLTVVLIMLAAFFLLGKIASIYLTPVLTKVSEALNMSETLSGVTLLAFANGAPDIIASFTAGDQAGGLYITIGNLYGAGLFCSTLVVARCIQVSKRRIVMERDQWNRDLIFYIMTSLLLVVYGIVSHISVWMASLFYVVYVCYIAVVLYQERNKKVEDTRETSLIDRHDHDKDRLQDKMNKYMHNVSPDKLLTQSMVEEDTLGTKKARHLTLTQAEVKNIYQHEQDSAVTEQMEEDASTADKVLHYITMPLKIFPMVTIPNLEEEEAAKVYSPALIVTGIFMSFLLIVKEEYATKLYFGLKWYYLALMVSLPLALLTVVLKSRGGRFFEWVMVPVALVTSILWLKTAAGSVVDLINYISMAYGVNKVLLGATFLGIGNTLADFFANSSLSALGYGVMACTGSIAGQLFNLLMGLPLNVFSATSGKEGKKADFNLTDWSEGREDKVFALMIMWMLICQLVFLFYMSISTNYELNARLAKINVVVYVTCYVVFFLMYAVVRD